MSPPSTPWQHPMMPFGGQNPVHLPMTTPVGKEEWETEELFIEPFVAWRAWGIFVDDDDGRLKLRSITYKTTWPPGEPLVAECMASTTPGYHSPAEHSCPDPGHSCGIHGLKSEEDAHRWMNYGFYIKKPELRCVGEVKLWGRIHRFTKGYLAEYGYPARLWLDPVPPEGFPVDSREAAHELRKVYRGVEVRLI